MKRTVFYTEKGALTNISKANSYTDIVSNTTTTDRGTVLYKAF